MLISCLVLCAPAVVDIQYDLKGCIRLNLQYHFTISLTQCLFGKSDSFDIQIPQNTFTKQLPEMGDFLQSSP